MWVEEEGRVDVGDGDEWGGVGERDVLVVIVVMVIFGFDGVGVDVDVRTCTM